ncbi:hypothetical protein [Burkholderia metallica]|uniref:hypothetical protein n=1 Tax=Burkholderia metallica TaxID=488729 RepID=UPI00131EC2EA|nr:hypothetical protein [Burkholderia metallica]
MIDATRGFTKRLHDSRKRLRGGPLRHFTVKTLALHFYGRDATVGCRQMPSAKYILQMRDAADAAIHAAAKDR